MADKTEPGDIRRFGRFLRGETLKIAGRVIQSLQGLRFLTGEGGNELPGENREVPEFSSA